MERKRKRGEDELVTQTIPQASLINDVRDPTQPVKTKGRPKVASRIKSSIELSTKQQKTCSYCQGKGHNKTGCQMLKVLVSKFSIYVCDFLFKLDENFVKFHL